MDAPAIRCIGQPLRRREDFRLLTGKGRYVDDIKLPGLLHLTVLRSPHAHAEIKRIDLTKAAVAPGVRLVLSAADLAGKIGPIMPNWIIPGARCRSARSLPPTAFALSGNAWH
jgi:aerobic carbon-monoxide dehydrogenase large subunit